MATPAQAWKALTDDKDPTNWITMQFDAGRSMKVSHTGTGGLLELKKHFDEKEVIVAAIKVVGVDQQQNVTSRRPKYVLITFIGKAVSALRKGLVLQKKAEIDSTFKGTTCLLQFSDCAAPPEGLTHLAVSKALLAAGGAHKPVFYDFGANEHLPLKQVYENKDFDPSAAPAADNKAAEAPAAAPAAADPTPAPAAADPAPVAADAPAAAPADAAPAADAPPADAPPS